MRPYEEAFPKGTAVRVADRAALEEFARVWKFHHPLEPRQLEYADAAAVVSWVGFYHGGDVLYVLDGLPGTWHEQCLRRA